MVKESSLAKLRAVLPTVEAGASATVDDVCRLAGVSRATAFRSTEFMAEFRTAKDRAGDGPPAPVALREIPVGAKVGALRTTVDLMANVIQALHVANSKLAEENRALRAKRPPV